VKGEITLVVGGAPKPVADADPDTLAAAVRDREQAGTDRKTAIAEVARERGLPKRVVYAAVVAAR
jgi:16S rRNA (cytidine1402-2'-O)-methyltransferase